MNRLFRLLCYRLRRRSPLYDDPRSLRPVRGIGPVEYEDLWLSRPDLQERAHAIRMARGGKLGQRNMWWVNEYEGARNVRHLRAVGEDE